MKHHSFSVVNFYLNVVHCCYAFVSINSHLCLDHSVYIVTIRFVDCILMSLLFSDGFTLSNLYLALPRKVALKNLLLKVSKRCKKVQCEGMTTCKSY